MLCLAKAYGGKPLERLLVGNGDAVVYLLNPSVENSTMDDGKLGVGFPHGSVFQHDSILFRELVKAHEAGDGERLNKLWETASPVGALPHQSEKAKISEPS